MKFLVRVWKNVQAQDLIEYALIAGLVALAAGAVMPGVAVNLSTIHSKLSIHASRVATF